MHFLEEKSICEVSSWTTGEEFCKTALESRNVGASELNGWTVSLQDENDLYELMGNDYVLDLLSEMEIAPAFPVCKSFFLVSSDKNKNSPPNQKRKSLAANSHNPDSVYNWYFEVQDKSKERIGITSAIKGKKGPGSNSNSNLDISTSSSVVQASSNANNYGSPHMVARNSNSVEVLNRNEAETPSRNSKMDRMYSPNRSNSVSSVNTAGLVVTKPPISKSHLTSSENSLSISNKQPLNYKSNDDLMIKSSTKMFKIKNEIKCDREQSPIKLYQNPNEMYHRRSMTTEASSMSEDDDDDDEEDDFDDDGFKSNAYHQKDRIKEESFERGVKDNQKPKKQKFRFRFEPNKTSLTEIVLKDSCSASETQSVCNSTLISHVKPSSAELASAKLNQSKMEASRKVNYFSGKNGVIDSTGSIKKRSLARK